MQQGYTRTWRYLRAMFPLHIMPLWGMVKFYAVYFSLQALSSDTPLSISWRSFVGAISIVLFTLLLRVYDELKDAEVDIRLGRAGDPRYRDRPIVTGAITVTDLANLRWAVTALLVVINVAAGSWILTGFAVLFLVTWLSLKWFFRPSISRSLLLAFVTHNPVTFFFGLYIVSVYVADFGPRSVDSWVFVLLLAFWAPLAAWETSRKIRAPEDETEYETYSQVFGWKLAPFVPVAFVLLGTACTIALSERMGLTRVFPALLVVASSVPVFRCIAFRMSPSSKTAVLQTFVELYAVVQDVGLLVAILMTRGIDVSMHTPVS